MKQYFIPGLFLAGTLFFGYLYIAGPAAQEDEILINSGHSKGSTNYSRLQQFKKETAVKMDINKQRAQMNKILVGPDLDPGQTKKNRFHKTELGHDLGPAAYDLSNEGSYGAVNLDQRMDEFLAKRQEYEELERVQRETYVETFIVEARRMGFIVKVNEDMEIVSVVKRKPATN